MLSGSRARIQEEKGVLMAVPTQFVHLHVASSYSLRYGTATPAALAARAAGLGMPALALTDRDGLYGAFKHVQACADAGIRPLLGADLGLLSPGAAPPRLSRRAGPAARTATVSDPSARTESLVAAGRVTLLATGRQGWASLCRLVSAAHATTAHASGEAGDNVPAVTRDLIAEHAAGLVMLLGPASDVGRAVAARRPDLARRALDRWRYLGVDTVIEIVDHLDRKSTSRAARLAELARDARTTAVLTNAVRYLDPVDSLTAQVLDAARHLVPLGSPSLVPHNGRAYLASRQDMAVVAKRVAAAMTGPGTASAATLLLGETQELTRRCTLDPARDLGVGSRHLPETEGTAYDQYKELKERCEQAIRHGRYRTANAASRPRGVSRLRAAKTARDRLEHELDIIAKTGLAAYFLSVADVADRIRQAGIRCAIRGSGAGSFVNHLLGISAIDPLEHDLLMERFLSPIRNTLPDIDLDVESARRLDAYRIIFDRYGKERTACVCMMETYRARSAIRDVAAAMSLPPDEIGAIAKSFPHIRAKHITAALTELPELRRSRSSFFSDVADSSDVRQEGQKKRRSSFSNNQIATIFAIAQQLDGLPRHVAMHPCGLLLSDRTLLDRTAVQASAEGFPLSQLDKDDAEVAGVIKLDVLGVRMQSAMAHALTEIERTESERIDLDAMPRDDPATYTMIGRSETIGCFQIESPGQRELVKKLAPRDVADLIVDISLFRPGPVNSDMIGPFLRTRHGLADPRYPHEKLIEALKETGGVVVFHEQVLRIIDVMTGCGLPEADLVRRHLSTDGGPDRTAPWFRARARARGFGPATVERVWQVVAAFGGFGFCKAHAAAFAIPVYQSAWLRRHHPAAFYAGVLTHDPGMYPKRVIIADARLSGIRVLPVDINASSADWTVASRGDTPDHRLRSGPLQALRFSCRGYRPGGRPPASTPILPVAGKQLPGEIQNWSTRSSAPASLPAIRCSLREVKGISDAEIARIVAGQPYTSLRDFWNRAGVSRPVAERLVLIGAFDHLYVSAPGLPGPPNAAAAPHSADRADAFPNMMDRCECRGAPNDPLSSGGAGQALQPQPVDSLNCRVPPRSPAVSPPPASLPSSASSPSSASPAPLWLAAPIPDISDMPNSLPVPGRRLQAPPRPSRRDLLARVGVLARQSSPARPGAPALDLFAEASAEAGDGMADLVPAGQLRELDLTERVEAELGILGFELSQHVLDFYADLLAGLGVVRSADLPDRENGETVLVAGAKVATQTPAVRSGQRIIFASLDDAAGLVDLAFFESVQDRCAARLFASWLLLVRGKVRRAGAGPMAVTVNATECWDLPALEEIRKPGGMDAVRAAMAAGDVGSGAHLAGTPGHDTSRGTASPAGTADPGNPAESGDGTHPFVFANGFTLSPYAETGGPGGSPKRPPRTLWHASPGSSASPLAPLTASAPGIRMSVARYLAKVRVPGWSFPNASARCGRSPGYVCSSRGDCSARNSS
jgi:error-prone DNA polymerase